MLSRQTEQVNLNCREVEELLVPTVSRQFQTEIEELVKEYQKNMDESRNYFTKAERLFLSELAFDKFNPEYSLTYQTDLSNVMKFNRIDAEYYQPAYKSIIAKLKQSPNGYANLLTLVSYIEPDFNTKDMVEKNIRYIELSNIDPSIGVIHSFTPFSNFDELPSRGKRLLRTDDIIVSNVEGSLSKVALVEKQYEGSIASNGFFQFRSEVIPPEVLLLMFKSMILQSQLKRECSGSILMALSDTSLSNVVIPVLSTKVQHEIVELVKKSYFSKNLGLAKFNMAVQKVERKIQRMIKR
jgi:hypothetical protein